MDLKCGHCINDFCVIVTESLMETTEDGGRRRGCLWLTVSKGSSEWERHGEQAPPWQTGAGDGGRQHVSEQKTKMSSRTRGRGHVQKQDPSVMSPFASQELSPKSLTVFKIEPQDGERASKAQACEGHLVFRSEHLVLKGKRQREDHEERKGCSGGSKGVHAKGWDRNKPRKCQCRRQNDKGVCPLITLKRRQHSKSANFGGG